MLAPLLIFALASESASPLRIAVVAASDSGRSVLEKSFRSLFPDTPLEWQPGPIDPRAVLAKQHDQHGPLFVWIDLSARTVAEVYLRDPAGRRFVIRTVPLGRLDAVAGETLAQVVRAGASALLDPGQPVLSATEVAARLSQPPAQAAPPPAPQRPQPGPQWEVGAGYTGRWLSRSLDWAHGPTVNLAAAFRISMVRWLVWASAAGARASFAGSLDELAGATLTPWSLRLGLGVEFFPARRIRIRLQAGAGVDVIEVGPRALAASSGEVILGQDKAVPLAAGLLGVGLVVPLGAHLSATVTAAAEVSPRLQLRIEKGADTLDVRTVGPWRGTTGAGLAWRW